MEKKCRDCRYCYEAYNRNSGKTGKFFCVMPAVEGIEYEDVGNVIGVLFKKDLDSDYDCEGCEKREDEEDD